MFRLQSEPSTHCWSSARLQLKLLGKKALPANNSGTETGPRIVRPGATTT
jgi:hypothetical protein